MRSAATYIVDLSGYGLASYGAWLAWHPAGYMVAGACALLLSYTIHRRANGEILK